MRPGLTAAIATILVAGPNARQASAASPACGMPGRPSVAIAGSVPELAALADLLRVELAGRGIDLNEAAAGCETTPIATIAVTRSERGAQIVVEVRDELTAKRVARDVDLAAVPTDSRPLTLAVAADELLRASWAELALVDAPRPAVAVPRAVEESLAREMVRSPSSPTTAGFGVAGIVEHWAGGATLYGADLRATAWPAPRVGAQLRLGLRGSSTVSAPDGQIRTSALVAGAGATVRVTPWERLGIEAVARLDIESVSYVAVPNVTASGSSQSGLALVAGGGVEGWVTVAPSLRLTLEGLMTLPLRPVRAQDSGRDVTAVSGIGVAGGLGLGVVL